MWGNFKNPLKLKTEKQGSFLSLDFGGSFLRAAIFSKGEDGKLNLSSFAKTPTPKGAVVEGLIRDEGALLLALSEIIKEVTFSSGTTPQKCVCGLSGQSVINFLTPVRLTRDNPSKPLDLKELTSFSDKIKDMTSLEVEKSLVEIVGSEEREYEITGTTIEGFKVDGYPLPEPLGFTGQTLEITISTEVAPTANLVNIRSMLKKLGLKLESARGLLSSITSIVGGKASEDFNAIMIDAGANKTEIGLVFGGEVVSNRCFGIGGADVSSYLGEVLNLTTDISEQEKLAYSIGSVSDESREKIGLAIEKSLATWGEGVLLTLSDFTGVKTFPDSILLFGGCAKMEDYTQALNKLSWTGALPFTAKPSVSVVSPEKILSTFINKTGRELEYADIFALAIGGVYFLDLGKTDAYNFI